MMTSTDHKFCIIQFCRIQFHAVRLIGAALITGLLLSSCIAAKPRGVSMNLPMRPDDAPTGTRFRDQVTSLSVAAREEAVHQEIARGNIPDFLRKMAPISVQAKIGDQIHTATYYATPDYLAIGTDEDFFRMPMSPILAQRIADLLGGSLPTRKMVNDIYSNATVKLEPSPIPPSSRMTTIPVFYQHHLDVEKQREGKPLGALIGGIKKDVVITSKIASKPNRVAIYGWHRLSGKPIQPLYLGHGAAYADYSHGIRIVDQKIMVDGAEMTIAAVLADEKLAALLSDEGAFTSSRYPIPDASTPAASGATR